MKLQELIERERKNFGLSEKQAEVFFGNGFVNLPLSIARNVFGEMLLMDLYRHFKSDGTFELGFHEIPNASWETFCSYFTQPPNYRNILIPCLVEDDDAIKEPLGMMWCDSFKPDPGIVRGNVSLWFFKKFWESRFPLLAARKGIEYCFEILRLNIVYGITPSENERSCAFARLVGMHECGEVPLWTFFNDKPCNAKLFFKEKEEG